MSNWKTVWKAAAPTVFLYLAFAIGVSVLEKIEPSDMCNPGAGVLLLFALPVLSVGLLIKNLFQLFVLHQPQKTAASLHFLVCIGIVVAVAIMDSH